MKRRVADRTVQGETPSLPGPNIVIGSTKTAMDDAIFSASRTNHESGKNASEAIMISDSEDDHGPISAPSESSKGTDSAFSSRDGSLALPSASSSATSLLRGLSDDSSCLKPELMASGFPRKMSLVDVSDSMVNLKSSDEGMLMLEEASIPSESGLTSQKTAQNTTKIVRLRAYSPFYTDVEPSSDMGCDGTHDNGHRNESPLECRPQSQANEELNNPTTFRDPSSSAPPEVGDTIPHSVSTRQGMQSPNHGPPGLLEKVFASDFEEASSEADSQHEGSSDDDHPFALAKAIATPIRELLSRPAHRLDFNDSNSNASDSLAADRDVESTQSYTRRHRSENYAPASLSRRRPSFKKRGRRQPSESTDGEDDREPSPSLSSQSEEPSRRRLSDAILALRSTDHETANGPVASFLGTIRTEASSTSLPKAANGKARRVLVPETPDLPLATISMRADANFLDRSKEFW